MCVALVFLLIVLVLIVGLLGFTAWALWNADQERLRISREVQLASWQLKQISRVAMQQMLDEARRTQAGRWQ